VRNYGTRCANCGTEFGSESFIESGKKYCSRACLYGTPQDTNVPNVLGNDDATWNGVYENIARDPIRITGGRRELIEVCNRHGVAAKALLKPRSQGSGYEMRTRRF
jgi:hypothetical protein